MGAQGRFLDASSLTRQSKYNLFRGAALHHLAHDFGIRTQHFALFSTNWEFGEGIPSPSKGAGIGNAQE